MQVPKRGQRPNRARQGAGALGQQAKGPKIDQDRRQTCLCLKLGYRISQVRKPPDPRHSEVTAYKKGPSRKC
ncbi:hypothetical protein HUJ04_012264 [Dendroctonus ponderosae]|nr:hypothetical protein HUJ04_012264 [Dendroctonus ponderosae]KAH1029422.1 hypothetical protein HUJ05_002669 [Dendroctonus ponderosae]